ncbi:hypothetical protein PoB_001989500 [Plakobranchus ocellatus]|uniref:Uncharacterized protein n=1 Tax=Plakobranchus ocellatus TaxID=259542 RepID=A0AAV3ZE20_9GAST|nr:hypothetical protein PoB_001989500 [Plakobranchus ocellatus]
MANQDNSPGRAKKVGKSQVRGFRYTDRPYPMVECTVPGLSHEAFDGEWNPSPGSVMRVDAFTRMFAVFKPINEEGGKAKEADTQSSCTNSDDDGRSGPSSNNTTASFSDFFTLKNVLGFQQVWQTMDSGNAFLNWPRLAEEYLAFSSCSEFTMTPALYDPDVPKWPLDFRFTLGFVGACTLTLTADFHAFGDGGEKILLWQNKTQVVMVNKETRQPTKIPSWFMDKYKDRGDLKQALVIKPVKRPAVTFYHPILVQWSDTDEFGHANWASYVQWAADAVHAALRPSKGSNQPPSASTAPALRGLTRETYSRGLAKFQVSYYRECVEGDQVEAHVWQDKSDGDPGLVYCCLVKDREEICQVKMWYFKGDKTT